MKNWKLYHPVLLSLYPALLYYAANRSEALIGNVVSPILVTLLIVLGAWILLWALWRDIAKASVVVSLSLIWFVSYGHVQNSYIESYSSLTIFSTYLIVWAFAMGLLVWKGLNKKSVEMFSGFLTIVGIYLVVSSLFRVIPGELERAQANVDVEKLHDTHIRQELDRSLQEYEPETKPDIYYIVPDRYARQDILEEFFDFDNSAFVQELEERGFYIADQSNANYPKTFLSLASSLNLRHLDAIPDIVGSDSGNMNPVFGLVQNNMVADYLKAQGYRFIYVGGWWEPTRVNRHADQNINLYADSDEFLRKYAQTTLLNPIFNHIFSKGDILGFSDHRVRENHLYQFKELKSIGSQPGPKFVMVHLLFPHSPYVLDENCSAYNTESDNKDPEEFIAQLQCANTQLLEIVDSIKGQSEEPPIILLQSDEGPFKVDEMNKHGEGVDWEEASEDSYRHHMGILNAYHVPAWQASGETGGNETSLPSVEESQTEDVVIENPLYETITPVNSFRLIFNEYFGTEFELLDDTSFIIPHLNKPYQYIDVTDVL